MTISAQVAVYPLRQERLTPAIAAVGTAFRQAAALGHVVMTVTVSNACPV